jgi:hypothetical protein
MRISDEYIFIKWVGVGYDFYYWTSFIIWHQPCLALPREKKKKKSRQIIKWRKYVIVRNYIRGEKNSSHNSHSDKKRLAVCHKWLAIRHWYVKVFKSSAISSSLYHVEKIYQFFFSYTMCTNNRMTKWSVSSPTNGIQSDVRGTFINTSEGLMKFAFGRVH